MAQEAPVSKNIHWHHGKLSKEDRVNFIAQQGAVVWFTGLSGSGKSTIAVEVEHALVENGINAFVLDGDNIRHGLNKNLGFSPEDRTENIRRIGEVAKLFAEANVVVLTAFISPYRADRDFVRSIVPAGQFLEVYVNAPLEVCEQRDPKGLYAKARAKEILEFTGISAPYEEPLQPELSLHTDRLSVPESVSRILEYLAMQDRDMVVSI